MEFNYISEMLEGDNRCYKNPSSGLIIDKGSRYLFKLKKFISFAIFEDKYVIDKVLMTTKNDAFGLGYKIVYVLNDGTLFADLYGVNCFKVSLNVISEICLMLKEYEMLSKTPIYKYSKKIKDNIENEYNNMGKERSKFVFTMKKFLADYELLLDYEKVSDKWKDLKIRPDYLPACDKFKNA